MITRMASSAAASMLASLHDIPTVSGGVPVSAETGEFAAGEDDYAACWAWFRGRLLREPLGPELFEVARRQYQNGLYDSAAVMLLLFRGAHPEIRVRGGGTDDVEVSHLWAHLLWKMGRNREALAALAKVVQGAPRGSHQYEECWQLLVELGLEREMDEHASNAKSGAGAQVKKSERPKQEDDEEDGAGGRDGEAVSNGVVGKRSK